MTTGTTESSFGTTGPTLLAIGVGMIVVALIFGYVFVKVRRDGWRIRRRGKRRGHQDLTGIIKH
ncbi:MAG: hypothetical protein WC729_11420 [Sphingomonas sp.]|jgi:uncharacterized membrane protein YciS (DUF1049 family)|uniref:hypothetical protein n=1 Tax=Sphingomonas sp. TaxID=28214 RepID=UPI0035649159